jgi:hypothetical protein
MALRRPVSPLGHLCHWPFADHGRTASASGHGDRCDELAPTSAGVPPPVGYLGGPFPVVRVGGRQADGQAVASGGRRVPRARWGYCSRRRERAGQSWFGRASSPTRACVLTSVQGQWRANRRRRRRAVVTIWATAEKRRSRRRRGSHLRICRSARAWASRPGDRGRRGRSPARSGSGRAVPCSGRLRRPVARAALMRSSALVRTGGATSRGRASRSARRSTKLTTRRSRG